MALSQLICAFAIEKLGAIRYCSALVGFSYGMIWSTTPTLVSEIFGAKEFALIWGWYGLAPISGSLIFNTIAGSVYESYVTEGNLICYGVDCHYASFIINSSAAVLGAIVAAIGVKFNKDFSKSNSK
jgi:MFS family permease